MQEQPQSQTEWESNLDCNNYNLSQSFQCVSCVSQLTAITPSYREQVERVNRLRDETIRAIVKNSSDIAEFKGEVAKRLRELRECAEMS